MSSDKGFFGQKMQYATGMIECQAGKLMHRKDWIEKGEKLMGSSKTGPSGEAGVNVANAAKEVDSAAKKEAGKSEGVLTGLGDTLDNSMGKVKSAFTGAEKGAVSSARKAEDGIAHVAEGEVNVAGKAVSGGAETVAEKTSDVMDSLVKKL
ncbi:hypothetical protein AYI70_g5608 [Smittium culicis]|uniref:Uncharacterized protein n=1 Tax=Smittium culicis TaxID=133412 RepID=A0A1R1XD31_9FUNG|nr:hypothetical protein AYI70_g9051 [Smittium culicis]OMJ18027.1 hypothetical protein AYI70_g5608 [Smittium culicis]